jgi:hypothetical protein
LRGDQPLDDGSDDRRDLGEPLHRCALARAKGQAGRGEGEGQDLSGRKRQDRVAGRDAHGRVEERRAEGEKRQEADQHGQDHHVVRALAARERVVASEQRPGQRRRRFAVGRRPPQGHGLQRQDAHRGLRDPPEVSPLGIRLYDHVQREGRQHRRDSPIVRRRRQQRGLGLLPPQQAGPLRSLPSDQVGGAEGFRVVSGFCG